jgi:hypothetical protein
MLEHMPSNPHKSAIPPIVAANGRNREHNTGTLLSKGKAPASNRQAPNTRHRWTDHVDGEKAIELVEAARHALIINRPLNLFVTIHFEKAELSPAWRAQDAVGEWLKRAGQWLGLRGIPNTFLWVLEHAVGTGLHAHIMLHCPPEYQKAFKQKTKRSWATKAGMNPVDRHAIDYQRIGPRNYDPLTATDTTLQMGRQDSRKGRRKALASIWLYDATKRRKALCGP